MNREELNKILENDNYCGVDLRGVNMQGVVMQGVDLCGAVLQNANLCEADLMWTNLRCADLRGANLMAADLRGADLTGADLRGADLRGAKLEGACTRDWHIDTETKIDWPIVCPETGSFIAWKKAGKYIVKLEVPADALRSSATTNKCRASWAKVLEIQNKDGTKADKTEVKSLRGKAYKAGKMVYPDAWDYNRWNECSNGIHFFMKREEAVEW